MPRARARGAAAEGARNRARALEKEKLKLERRALRKKLKKELHGEDFEEIERFSTVNIIKVLDMVNEKKRLSKTAFIMLRYLCFIAIYIAVIIIQRNAWDAESMYTALMSYFNGKFRDEENLEMLDFGATSTPGEIWGWIENMLLGLVYINTKTNYEPNLPIAINTMVRFNKLTTGFRLVQRRSKAENCNFGDGKYDNFVPGNSCFARTYGEALIGSVDREPFYGTDGVTKYVYETIEVGLPGSGSFDVGYFQYFGQNLTETKEKIAKLKQNRWINAGTQWARIEVVVYNPNLSAFGVLQFKVDYDNSGFIVAKSNLEVVNAAMYGNAYDGLRAALEIMIALMWFVYVIGMLTNMIVAAKFERKTWAYFNNPIHIVFAIQLVTFALIGALWMAIVNDPARSDLVVTRDVIKDKSGGPPSFTSTVLLTQAYYIINGLNILLTVVQLLSFFQVNYNLSMLTDTIGFMIGELLQFCVVLVTMIISFMLLSHIYFGQYMKEFSTLDECFVNVFEYLFSRADFFILAEMDFVAAYLFFVPFTFIMVFVVANIVIAIILDGYTLMQSKREVLVSSNIKVIVELTVTNQMWHGFVRMLQPIKRIVPRKWHTFKTDNGAELNRYEVPSRREVFDLLTDQADYENPFTDFNQLQENLAAKGREISLERLQSIFDRYDAWVDPEDIAPDPSIKQIKQFTILKQSIYTIMADQKRIDAKINTLVEIFPTLP